MKTLDTKKLIPIILGLIILIGIPCYLVNQENQTVQTTQIEQTVSIQHESGITEVKVNPKRIVCMDFGVLDILDQYGIQPEMLATPKAYTPSYLSKYNTDKVEDIGGMKQPDLEKIKSLNPDLIIISGRAEPYYEKLNEIAPTINLRVDNNNYMPSLKNQMDILATIFNKQDKAEGLYAALENKVSSVRELSETSGKKGLMVITVGNKINAYGPGMRFGLLFDKSALNLNSVIQNDGSVGSKSPAGKVISYEFIKEANPDYILIIDRNAAVHMDKETAHSLFDNELVKQTNAYKNNKIVYLDNDVWYLANNGVMSTLKMVDDIAEVLKY